jgi:hypothetical protein
MDPQLRHLTQLVQRHLGERLCARGWTGLFAMRPRPDIPLGTVLPQEDRLIFDDGPRKWALSPTRPTPIVPPDSSVVVAADDGSLCVGFDFPNAADPLEALPDGAQSLPIHVAAEIPPVYVGRLLTRPWSPLGGNGKAVLPAPELPHDPDREWVLRHVPPSQAAHYPPTTDTVDHLAPPLIGGRGFVHLPAIAFAGLARHQFRNLDRFWLAVPWPEEDRDHATKELKGALRLNVVPYCDRVYEVLDKLNLEWHSRGERVLYLRGHELISGVDQGADLLHVAGPGGVVYHRASRVLDPSAPTFLKVRPRDDQFIAGFRFDQRPEIETVLARYAPRESIPLGADARVEPGERSLVESAELLPASESARAPDHGARTWAAFGTLLAARGRCVTEADFRAAISSSDLFGVTLAAEQVAFERGFRRIEGAYASGTDVVIPEPTDLTAMDLEALRSILQRQLQERSGLGGRLSVRWGAR